MKGHDEFDASKREEGITELLDYVRGASDYGSIFEKYTPARLAAFEQELQGRLKTATAKERHKLHFDLALLRSLRYATASSRHCRVLGIVNGVRELYEGARLTGPLEET